MRNVPLVSSNAELKNKVKKLLKPFTGNDLQIIEIDDCEKAVEYLSTEMPELILLDYTDPAVNAQQLMTETMKDAWLLNGGIVAFCKSDSEAEKIENIKGTNLIASLTHHEFSFYLPKIMEIILNNRRILFQRGIGIDIVGTLSGSFKLENDPCVAKCYVNLICNFLFNTGRLSQNRKYQLKIALTEMLLNSIEHGNCQITFDEKADWLRRGEDIADLIRHKDSDPEINRKRVTFEYSLESSKGRFIICDEGEGFDWRNYINADIVKDVYGLNGRGILMAKVVSNNLSYNEKGNEVSFEIDFDNGDPDLLPGLFKTIKPRDITEGEIIFREGEKSNFLYYIVKGTFSVIVNDKVISTLTPDDILLGEMAFLLDNQRSATVKAESSGRLIEITKREFVEAIKAKPHYGIFLCRLLAQRIQRTNQTR